MVSGFTSTHKSKIKEMVDQLIVNHGILVIEDRSALVDGMDLNQLSHLAFKYYKMIYSDQGPLDLDLAVVTATSQSQDKLSANPGSCLGCNKPLTESDGAMPVCVPCWSKLKADYDILMELLR